jgi:hypothetical protein
MLLGIFLAIFVASVINWMVSIPPVSPKQDKSYFSIVEGTFYDNPTITEAARAVGLLASLEDVKDVDLSASTYTIQNT